MASFGVVIWNTISLNLNKKNKDPDCNNFGVFSYNHL